MSTKGSTPVLPLAMFYPFLLDMVVADGISPSVKICNEHLFSPLVFDNKGSVQELEPKAMINIPIIQQECSPDKEFDSMLIELLSKSKRCARFDILNSDPNNLKHFIKRGVQDFKENIEEPITKIAVIGNSLSLVEEPFKQLLKNLEYVKFVETPLVQHEIFLVPFDVKCGAIINQGRKQKRYGMVLYEDCVKRLIFYSDNDLSLLLEHLLVDFDSGEL